MKNMFRALMVAVAAIGIPAFVHAQSGCVDSPEDPTLVLALVASAGAIAVAARNHLKARKNSGR
jgi:XrtJ-associated TM-motif-TM protein